MKPANNMETLDKAARHILNALSFLHDLRDNLDPLERSEEINKIDTMLGVVEHVDMEMCDLFKLLSRCPTANFTNCE